MITQANRKISFKALVVSLFFIIAGFTLFFFRIYEEKTEKTLDLQTIAVLKAEQLIQWRKERISEARFFSNNQLINNYIDEYNDGEKAPRADKLNLLLEPFLDSWRYENISLFTASGEVIYNASVDSTSGVDRFKSRILNLTASKEKMELGFNYSKTENKPWFDIIILLESQDHNIKGGVLLRSDPEKYLYPFLQSWPAQRNTSESILAQIEGDSILFLNRMRLMNILPMEYKVSLNANDAVAVQLLRGKQGIFKGSDYRGKKILGYISPIPQTPWYMISKLDRSEIFASLYIESVLIIISIFLTVALTIVIFSLIERTRDNLIYFESQQTARIGSWDLNPGTGEMWWSDETYRIFGLLPGKVKPNSGLIDTFIVWDDITPSRLTIVEMIKHEVGIDIDIKLRLADDTIKYCNIKGKPVNIKSGKVVRYFGTCMDITERKIAETEIKRFNEKLTSLVEAVKEISQVHEQEKLISFITAAARKLISSDFSVFLIREDEKCRFLHEDPEGLGLAGRSVPAEECICSPVLTEEKRVLTEEVFLQNGSAFFKEFPVGSMLINPVKMKPSHGAVCVYWIEKHMPTEMESQLLETLADAAAIALDNVKLYSELEARVDERTSRLLDLNKELEAFSYSVSHDLRAPLRGIDGFTKMLVEEHSAGMSDEAKKLCAIISENTRKMSILIDDLLAFSKLVRRDLKQSWVNMHDIVVSVYNDVTTEEERQRIRFISDNLAPAWGDSSMLRQVWANLISNAVKFSSKRPDPEIHISSHNSGRSIIYSVKDNGVGFDMRYANKLFGVFQRLHSNREFVGTGVGLAIVQRIIFRHGGEVWAEGKTGEGASFFFTLPSAENLQI